MMGGVPETGIGKWVLALLGAPVALAGVAESVPPQLQEYLQNAPVSAVIGVLVWQGVKRLDLILLGQQRQLELLSRLIGRDEGDDEKTL